MAYRLEYAKSNRGGCNVAACKQHNAKVPKGGLKFGVWIDPSNSDPFFSWKHWGCVTPANLADVHKELDGDYAGLDGYEDLTEADQERVAQALIDGKIAKGDETTFSEAEVQMHEEYLADEERLKEMRREFKETGQKFELKVERKKLEDQRNARHREAVWQAKADAKAAEKAAKLAAKEAKFKIPKVEAQKVDSDDKKRKHVKSEAEDEEVIKDEDDAEPAPKKQNRNKTVPKTKEVQPALPVRRSAREKKTIKAEVEEDGEEDSDPEEPIPKAKQIKAKKAIKAESDDEEVIVPKSKAKKAIKTESDDEEVVVSKPKATRTKKASKAKSDDADEPAPKAKATRKSSRTKT